LSTPSPLRSSARKRSSARALSRSGLPRARRAPESRLLPSCTRPALSRPGRLPLAGYWLTLAPGLITSASIPTRRQIFVRMGVNLRLRVRRTTRKPTEWQIFFQQISAAASSQGGGIRGVIALSSLELRDLAKVAPLPGHLLGQAFVQADLGSPAEMAMKLGR